MVRAEIEVEDQRREGDRSVRPEERYATCGVDTGSRPGTLNERETDALRRVLSSERRKVNLQWKHHSGRGREIHLDGDGRKDESKDLS